MLPPVKKALAQARYLEQLPEAAKDFFPRVLHAEQQVVENEDGHTMEYRYDMSYIEGIEVSHFVREYSPSPRVVAMLYAEIFRVLNEKIHSQNVGYINFSTLEQSYFKKIEDRLELCRATSPGLFGGGLLDADYVLVDGKLMKNYHQVIGILRRNKLYREVLEPKFHNLVMGDTNTENIKIENVEPLLKIDESKSFTERQFTAEEIGLKFLDPRAIGFHIDGEDSGVDDYMYDNKPWHNSIGNYDDIHGEHFDIEYRFEDGVPRVDIDFHEDSPYRNSYAGIEQYFPIVMNMAYEFSDPNSNHVEKDPEWLVRFVFLMGTHFMAMPPFHFKTEEDGTYIDDAKEQKRALAIYCEGLRWLNWAIDILDGKEDIVCGVYLGGRYRLDDINFHLNKMKNKRGTPQV
jgi:hypothetical protein